MGENEVKLLNYLVTHFQSGRIDPDDPKTHLPYSKVLSDLELPNDRKTPGDSLSKHAMGGLAEWLFENRLPAITGVIINKLSDPDRPGFPSKSYFQYHKREDLDFRWQRNQLELACELDWVYQLRSLDIAVASDFELPDEVPESLKEGAKKTITVNAYERNNAARNACIKHYGLECAVCGFSFKASYGERGEGFIHVHHLVAIADIGEEYEVDPIEHLRPVCPNCHAMLHTKGNISIENLKDEISFIKALQRPKH